MKYYNYIRNNKMIFNILIPHYFEIFEDLGMVEVGTTPMGCHLALLGLSCLDGVCTLHFTTVPSWPVSCIHSPL